MYYDPDAIIPFKNQNYEEIKAQLIESNSLFEDPLFPACDESIFRNKPVPAGIKWMRPTEACYIPQFSVDSFDRSDMDQGQIGDCWFIAAVSGISQNEALFSKVVPKDQSFTENYSGIFHFRFWSYCRWIDVVIDDRLPYASNGKLLFSSNVDSPNEFWCSLLEKAYAKFYGYYERLIAGHIFNGYIDLSGGIQEKISIKHTLTNEEKEVVWSSLVKANKKGALMGCNINAEPNAVELVLSNGLVRGHAYTITDIAELQTLNHVYRLIRCRNPWGNKIEWKGAWSDKSNEWKTLTQLERNLLGYFVKKDGEFWMTFSDFIDNWDHIGICHLTPDSYFDELTELDDDSDLEWRCKVFTGNWKKKCSAGGSSGPSYWTNPQYLIDLKDVDDNDGEIKSTVLISLMQKDGPNKPGKFFIAFKLFKVKHNVNLVGNGIQVNMLPTQLLKSGSSGAYENNREVCSRFRLDPGRYVIIPSTYKENQESEFLIRIFTEQKIKQ